MSVVAKHEAKKTDVRARVEELRAMLERANRAYYVDAAPVMSDVEFDRLLAELAQLERDHPELDDPESPTHRVGGEPIDGFETVPHAEPMLSIDNTYDLGRKDNKGLLDWHDRVVKDLGVGGGLFGGSGGPVLVADAKIDGIAMSLRYEHGRLARAITRGDGTKGDDVTANVRTIRAVPLTLTGATRSGVPDVLEIRGEVYFPLKEFERVNKEREAEGEDLFLNPRNAAAGTLKQLDPKITASRRLGFVAHGKGEISDRKFAASHSQFLERLKGMGMPVNTPLAVTDDIDKVVKAIRDFDSRRHKQQFATDGVVVRLDSLSQQEELGFTSKSPRAFVAYKYPAERKTTVLIRVDPQVGKSGRITPRAVMEPVLLAGTVVQHASLHNYGRVRDASTSPDEPDAPRTDIRVGDTVYVEKAGEIIPYVAGVVLSKRPNRATQIDAPTECPVCSGPIEIEYDQSRLATIDRFSKLPDLVKRDKQLLAKTIGLARREQIAARLEKDERALLAGPPKPIGPNDETARTCLNPECPAQVREKLIWFAGRRQMDIDGLGDKSVDRIRSSGHIPLNSFADIFRLREYRKDLVTLGWRDPREGQQDKERKLDATTMVDNLLAAIEVAKTRGLSRLLAGMGISHVGDATAKTLCKLIEDLDDLLALPEPLLRPKTLTQAEARPYLSHRKAELLGLSLPSKDRPETGLGAETARPVYDYLHSAPARKAFRELFELGVDLSSHEFSRGSNPEHAQPLSGLTFVITGSFGDLSRDELTERVESLGGKVSSSVSSKTSVVIAGDSPGSKLDKAAELGIAVWDLARLRSEMRRLGIA